MNGSFTTTNNSSLVQSISSPLLNNSIRQFDSITFNEIATNIDPVTTSSHSSDDDCDHTTSGNQSIFKQSISFSHLLSKPFSEPNTTTNLTPALDSNIDGLEVDSGVNVDGLGLRVEWFCVNLRNLLCLLQEKLYASLLIFILLISSYLPNYAVQSMTIKSVRTFKTWRENFYNRYPGIEVILASYDDETTVFDEKDNDICGEFSTVSYF